MPILSGKYLLSSQALMIISLFLKSLPLKSKHGLDVTGVESTIITMGRCFCS